MTVTISEDLVQAIVNDPTFDTHVRVLFSVLSRYGKVDTGELAATLCVSRKVIMESIKRLAVAGFIQSEGVNP